MSRTKSYVDKPMSVIGETRKSSGSNSGTRLLQLAPMPGAVHAPPIPKRSAVQVRANLTAEPAAAVIVPHGASVGQGTLELVGPGASVTAPGGSRVAGLLHADGTAVQFVGDGGGVFLSAALAIREFGTLMPAARRMLHVGPPASAAPAIHRRADSAAPVQSTAAVDTALKSSAAQPLPTRNRSRLESSFGTSLSAVRVHTDSAADRAANSVQAKAFTTGQDVYFRAGQFQPGSSAGDHLLAHEVAHTVQQGNGSAGISRMPEQGDWHVSQPTDSHEHEAERAADAATRGNRAVLNNLSGAPITPTLSRRAASPDPAMASAAPAAPGTAPPSTSPGSTNPLKSSPPAGAAADSGTSRAAANDTSRDSGGGSNPTKKPDAAGVEAPADKRADKAAAKGAETAPDQAEAKSAGSGKSSPGKAAAADSGISEIGQPKGGGASGTKAKGGAEPETAAGGDSGAGLAAVVAEVSAAGHEQQAHESVGAAANQTVKAADVTPEEAADKARGEQVKQMAAQKKGPFNRERFKEALRLKIIALQTDDAKNIKEGDKAQDINSTVKAGVAAEKQAAAEPIDQAAKQTPAKGEVKPGEKLPDAAPAPAPQVDGAKAIPGPVSEERRSMAAESQAVDQQMAAANVTPEQLRKANDPAFQAAADAQATAKTEADALPANAQTAEATVLEDSRAKAAQTTQAGLGEMQGQRSEKLAGSKDEQKDGKAKYEAARKRIAEQLGAIYEETKKSVDTRMTTLDAEVDKAFDEGASAAKRWFYAFIGTKLLVHYLSGGWLVDAFTGGNSKEEIFQEGRNRYLADMEGVIDRVADVVEKGLNDVVGIIEAGRVRLEAAMKQFGPEDAAVAEEVAGGLRDQFASLEKSVEEKQTAIVDSVAKKYVAAQKDVDSTINALRDPVGALIDMAVEAVAGVIETILKMKELLMSALAKAGEAIDLILADPIAFLGYLVAGVKQGVEGFLANIGTYLQKGLLDWLFGALSQAGIQMPEKFDLSGLMSVVLQVLGLTWANIRQRAVAIVGENVVKTLETGSEIFVTLVTKGAAGLWEYIKEQASALMETLKEGVKSFIMESVIVAGVKWLIGLLNPASAFVKACMAIYDIVTFIINKGQQILSFVNAVLDSILSIAKGAIAPAAKAVEAALASAIPVAIGFLASLLGIGDLGEKIKKVIDKIQEPINKVIDWLIKKAVQLVKSIGKLFGAKDDKSQSGSAPAKEIHVGTSMHGESHDLFAKEDQGELLVEMASKRRTSLKALVDNAIKDEKNGLNRQEVLDSLHLMQEDLKSVRKYWFEARRASTTSGDVSNADLTLIAKHLDTISSRLRDVGDKHDIKELQGIGKRKTIYADDDGVLKPQYKADVRKFFYPSSWSGGVISWRNTFIAKNRIATKPDHFVDAEKTVTPNNYADIDHITPVAIRWNNGENNQTQEERNASYNALGDLQVLNASENRKKGSGGNTYAPKVGDRFRGPDDDAPHG